MSESVQGGRVEWVGFERVNGNMAFQDRVLTCRDCGKSFTWQAGEQAFFASKGYTHAPSRCKEHRLKHKAQIEGVRGLPHQKKFEITCSNCGKVDSVSFEPSGKQTLLCSKCFVNQRVAKASVSLKVSFDREGSKENSALIEREG